MAASKDGGKHIFQALTGVVSDDTVGQFSLTDLYRFINVSGSSAAGLGFRGMLDLSG